MSNRTYCDLHIGSWAFRDGALTILLEITNLDDPHLAPYRDIKDRDPAAEGDAFIAEGMFVVERLLRSALKVQSVLCAQGRAAALAGIVPPDVPIYAADKALLSDIVGYKFHQGVLAVGERPRGVTLSAALSAALRDDENKPLSIMVLERTRNAENLGSLIRIAAAFGIDAMVLGPGCADPYARRTIRVSMGNAFFIPLIESADLHADLAMLRDTWRTQLFATTLHESATPLMQMMRPGAPARDRIALLFGPEDFGLSDEIIALCDHNITLPMRSGTDSLNVAAAAAVFCYHFCASAGAARRE